jgi:hypothetical protein
MKNKEYRIDEEYSDEWDEPLMDFDEWKAEYRARRNERILNGETIEETDNHWNPNVPFTGTQDEWFEHFLKIEEGEFFSMEESKRIFNAWKKEFLNNETRNNNNNHWNPNVPFTGTQDEWFEHFLKIEEGEFVSAEEHKARFDAWEKDFLSKAGRYREIRNSGL